MYAWDIRQSAGGGRDLTRVANEVWDDLLVPTDERRLAGALVSLVAKHAAPIDRDLSAVTTNWRLERLGAIERSVLRLGAAELAGDATPPRVAIQEAVRLAERYGSVQSAKFVNGVLCLLAFPACSRPCDRRAPGRRLTTCTCILVVNWRTGKSRKQAAPGLSP